MNFSEDDLIKTSLKASKPDKENSLNAPYRFPKYIYGNMPEIQLFSVHNSPITFVHQENEEERIRSEFKIYPEKILRDPRTTCMIKNIPNKFAADMLVDFMNETHFGKYDFLYLRMDFKNKCNVGYAFVNFVDVESVARFYKRIFGKRWKSFGSSKVAELTYASIQGQERLIRKFKRSSIMQENKSFRPKIFYTSGSLKGYEKPTFE